MGKFSRKENIITDTKGKAKRKGKQFETSMRGGEREDQTWRTVKRKCSGASGDGITAEMDASGLDGRRYGDVAPLL